MLGWNLDEISESPLLKTFSLQPQEVKAGLLALWPEGPKLRPLLRLVLKLDSSSVCQKVELFISPDLVSHAALEPCLKELLTALSREVLGDGAPVLAPGEQMSFRGTRLSWTRGAREHVVRFEKKRGFGWWS